MSSLMKYKTPFILKANGRVPDFVFKILLSAFLMMMAIPVFSRTPESGKPAFANVATFVSFTNNQVANGIDQDELVFQVTDGLGNPVSGQSVFFSTTSGATKEVSDASGNVYFDLGNYSTSASTAV